MIFMTMIGIWNFMRSFDEAFVPKTNMYLSLFRCEV